MTAGGPWGAGRGGPGPARGAETGAGAESAGARRLVTALFADLVGSTALTERLDPEDAYELLGGAVTLVVGRVEALGGTVKDLAGDGVLALFGAPVAHEDDAVRAVLCGLRIVDAVADYADEVAGEYGVTGLSVRVGIETGHVVTGPVGGGSRVEYGATGDALNTAARLQSHAAPGTVLVGATTRRMTGSRFRWGSPETFRLKGKDEAVEAAAALAVEAAGGPVPAASATTVGRDRELAALARALDRVAAGGGGVVAILAEAGVGKSRLVAEAHRFAAEHAAAWLRADAASYSGTTPFAHIRTLVLGWLGLGPEPTPEQVRVAVARRAEVVPEAAGPLQVLLPVLAGEGWAVDDEDAESLQERLFHAVQHLVELQAHRSPTVVVLEDLHWSDPTSLALTERLALLAPTSRFLLLVTARPEDSALAMLRRVEADEGTTFTRLALEPLHHQETRQLLHALLGGTALPAPLERRLLDTTEGNPFFVEEQVRALAASGALDGDNTDAATRGAVGDVALAPTLERALVARIDRLPGEERRTLLAAAVLGPRFDAPLLAEVLGHDPAATLEALRHSDMVVVDDVDHDGDGHGHGHGGDGAAAATAPSRYRFHHALLQEAAYGSLLRRRRRTLHARAAQALRTRYAGREDDVADALGRHLAAAGDVDAAVPYLRTAARRALDTFANEEAVRLARTAEAVLTAPGVGASGVAPALPAELADIEGTACCALARYEEAEDAYLRLLALLPADDLVARARVRVVLGEVLQLQHEYDAALMELQAAAESLRHSLDDPGVFAVWLDAMLAQGNVFYWLRAHERYAEMLRGVEPLVEERATPEQRLGFYSHVRAALLRQHKWLPTEDLRRLDRRVFAAEIASPDEETRGWGHFMHGFVLLWARDVDAAEPQLRQALDTAEHLGGALLRARSLAYLMLTARFRGDVDAAAGMVDDVRRAAAEAALPEYDAMAAATAAWVAHHRRDPVTVRKEGERALDVWARLPNRYVVDWLAALPLLAEAVDRRDADDAVRWAAAVLDPDQQELPEQMAGPLRRGIDAAEADGDRTAALRHFASAVEAAGTLRFL